VLSQIICKSNNSRAKQMTAKTSKKTIFLRVLILVISIVVGIAIVANFVARKQPPERIQAAETQRPVQVIKTALMPYVIKATGFGTASPQRTWSAISNVKGRVIFRHAELESGAVLAKDTLLMEIDDNIYQLALTEIEAEIASLDAEVAQLNQEGENISALFELEEQRLSLAEADLERTSKLVDSGSISKAGLDAQLKATLQQRQAVQSLLNQLNIIPIKLTKLDAQKERLLTKREQVMRDIEDTKIYAPFDIRISEVKAQKYQYINPSQLLFSGDGIKASEVVLQMPMQSLHNVLSQLPTGADNLNLSDVKANVQLVGESQNWDAKVMRIANGIDPATRTIRVVLSVEQPKDWSNPNQNPPLFKGMYVLGSLSIKANQPSIIIPQASVRENWVYLVDADNRLERREVEVEFYQDGLAFIQSGLEVGEVVILDDIVPAISGILLNPKRDLGVEEKLINSAMGAGIGADL